MCMCKYMFANRLDREESLNQAAGHTPLYLLMQQQEVCCYAAVLQTLQRAHIGQALLAKHAYSVPARRSGHARMCELSD